MNLAHLFAVEDTVHIIILIRNFHAVTYRSCCVYFCLINDGTKTYVFRVYLLSERVFRDQKSLVNAAIDQ
jgi:hypothetical protein